MSVQAGPLFLALVGFLIFSCGMYFYYLFALDEKMPHPTFRISSSRLAIILLSASAAIATEVAISTALGDGGYVFMAGYRIDSIVATIWCAIATFLLCIYDVYIYTISPKVIKRRAARSRQARRDGKPAPKVPSPLLVALKKSIAPLFTVITFCLYGTVLPMAFQAAKTDEMRLVVYSSAMVFKTGCEYIIKKTQEKLRVPYFAVVLGLFSFEMIVTTQIRIQLSSFQDAELVAYASTLSAVYELGVRTLTLFNLRREMSELKTRGLDAETTQLLVRKAMIFAAVSPLRELCVCLQFHLVRVPMLMQNSKLILMQTQNYTSLYYFVLQRKYITQTICTATEH